MFTAVMPPQPSCGNSDLLAKRKAGPQLWYTKYIIQELT
jgi:hypothetical protein